MRQEWFGCPTSNSSLGVTGGVSAEQGSSGIQVSWFAQTLGSGTRVDRWRRRSSSLGYTVIALLTPGGHGICEGNLPRWWGSGGLESTDGLARLGFPFTGLGISDLGGDGPEMACSLQGCTDGPGKHCCLWDCGEGLVKHCCLWESAHCWGVGRF